MNVDVYLGYDGVLLPFEDGIAVSPRYARTRPTLLYADTLAELLKPLAGVSIVLNTWWSLRYGNTAALGALPDGLRCRVVDDVFGKYLSEHQATQQTLHRPTLAIETIKRRRNPRWLVLDHTTCRWPVGTLHRAILLHPSTALASPQALDHIRNVLAMLI